MMTSEELEQVIRESIKDIYKATYIGKIWIKKMNFGGWLLLLGLHIPEAPLSIYADLEDDKFIEFIKQELKSRNLASIYFTELNEIYPFNNNCND